MRWTVMVWALLTGACVLPDEQAEERWMGDVELEFSETEIRAIDLERPEQGLIVCHLRVHDPHHSRHEPVNANVVADTTCTSVVPRIDMDVTLSREGLAVGRGGADKGNREFLRASASAPCVVGVYRGGARSTIYFPPGYSPNPQTIDAASAERHIPCTLPADIGSSR